LIRPILEDRAEKKIRLFFGSNENKKNASGMYWPLFSYLTKWVKQSYQIGFSHCKLCFDPFILKKINRLLFHDSGIFQFPLKTSINRLVLLRLKNKDLKSLSFSVL
jgi:hypothetical protein